MCGISKGYRTQLNGGGLHGRPGDGSPPPGKAGRRAGTQTQPETWGGTLGPLGDGAWVPCAGTCLSGEAQNRTLQESWRKIQMTYKALLTAHACLYANGFFNCIYFQI